MSEISDLDADEPDQWSDTTSSRKLLVSGRFIAMSFLTCMCFALALGRAARLLLIEGPRRELFSEYRRQSIMTERRIDANPYYKPPSPLLVANGGESVSHTKYSSEIFNTKRSVATSSWRMSYNSAASLTEEETEHDSGDDDDDDDLGDDDECEALRVDDGMPGKECSREEQADEPQPAAEHYMVDIKNVDKSFLNSEHQLVQAMLTLVGEAGLTLLSYHCHGFSPSGVSCVGRLSQNHVALHTWPEAGVIAIDLCTAESGSVLPFLHIIKRLFGVSHTPVSPDQLIEPPEMRWAYFMRGFPNNPTEISALCSSTDLTTFLFLPLGLEGKEEVVSVQTDFQRIDIYDARFPNSDIPLPIHKSYISQHPFLYRPERVLLLDGFIQSTLFEEAVYHEALVHPALFTHPDPKHVAIIGGGEGATLREVLKHNTVKEAVMIEIDEMMVNVSREYLPEWSDCSDLVGSTPCCVDDPRATVYYEDALKWFTDRYSDDKDCEAEELVSPWHQSQ